MVAKNKNNHDLGEQLAKAKTVDELLDVIFADYETEYFNDPPQGRKEFLEKVMDKIWEKRKCRALKFI